MEREIKNCQFCKKELPQRTRTLQKFCNHTCRNFYHNANKSRNKPLTKTAINGMLILLNQLASRSDYSEIDQLIIQANEIKKLPGKFTFYISSQEIRFDYKDPLNQAANDNKANN